MTNSSTATLSSTLQLHNLTATNLYSQGKRGLTGSKPLSTKKNTQEAFIHSTIKQGVNGVNTTKMYNRHFITERWSGLIDKVLTELCSHDMYGERD